MAGEQILEERALVHQAQKGDDQAFAELLKRHGAGLAAVIWNELSVLASDLDVRDHAQDLLQEVSLTIWDNLGTFDPDRTGGTFAAWANTIARREAIDTIRYLTADRRSVQRQESHPAAEQTDWFANLADSLSSPSRIVSKTELIGWVRQILDALRPIDREVLRLCELEEKSVSEAAEILGISVTAVCNRRKRGRVNLAKLLEGSLPKYQSGNTDAEGTKP